MILLKLISKKQTNERLRILNMHNKKNFLKGLTDGLPICVGYLSVSFAFGIFAVENGFTIWQALIISMTNVTSAGQLAAVPIIAGGGTLLEIAISQLIINSRYALMSVSLSQKVDKSINIFDRFIISFVNTDEVFAVASGQYGFVGKGYMYGLILTPYLGWSIGTLIGAAAGNILPGMIVSALGIAIYGMFLAIVVPPMKKEKSVILCVIIAVVLSCIFKYVPFFANVPGGFAIIICAVFASLICAFVAPVKEEENE